MTVDENGQAFIKLGSPTLQMGEQTPMAIAALDRNTYLSQEKGDAPAVPFHFIEGDVKGKAAYLSFMRLLKRE